jgi:hypothetical protein
MAATGVTFENRVVATRDHFVRLSENQLPFRQLPMVCFQLAVLVN